MCRSHHNCRHEFVLMQNSEICCGPGFRTFMDNIRDDLNPIFYVPCPYTIVSHAPTLLESFEPPFLEKISQTGMLF